MYDACYPRFYPRKGTGIFVNTGKTKDFLDHSEAEKFFNNPKPTKACRAGNEALCEAAAAAGYDSIQFTNHNAAASCGKTTCLLELVSTKLQGKYACTDNAKGASLKAGWGGSRTCDCVEAAFNGHVNCKGVPMT
jgi:hypothetical protein